MSRIVAVLITFLLVGCAGGQLSQPRDLESASQQQGVVVSCSGYKAWQDCDRAAAKACPNGYDVLGKEENLVTQGRTLRIHCK